MSSGLMGQVAGQSVPVRRRLSYLLRTHEETLVSIVAALTEPRSVIAYLDGVGLPSRAPPITLPAHLDRQLEFDEAA